MSEERWEVPAGWEWRHIGEVVDVFDGQRIPVNLTERKQRPGSIPYYGATGQVGWIDDYLFDEELILLGEDGAPFLDRSRHKAYIIKGRSWVNNHAHVLRARNLTTNRYICHYLNCFNYTGFVNGTTRLKLTQGAMREIPIPIAPVSEQHRITETVERLFAQSRTTRESLEHVSALVKQFRQSVLAAAFRGELTERDPNDEPAAELLERIRDERLRSRQDAAHAKAPNAKRADLIDAEAVIPSDLAALPQGWQWATVAQFADVHLGRQRSPARAIGPNMRPYLRAANVTWRGLDLSDVKQMDFSPKEQVIYRLRPGDLVLSEASGSPSEVGKPALWNDEIPECCIQNTLIRVRSDGPLPKYLFYHFLWDALAGRFGQVSQGIQINHLGAKGLSSWPVSLAPLAEQQRVVAKIEALFAQADTIKRAVEVAQKRAEKVDQAILARAFRGELISSSDNVVDRYIPSATGR